MAVVRMEPILIPKHLQINPAELAAAVLRAVDKEAESIRDDYGKASADFSDKPTFYIQKHGKYGRLIATRDEEFSYTTLGTAPHMIQAHGRFLAFQANYQRKTIVGQIATRPGGASGPMVYTRQVAHPGFEGTMVHEKIAEEHQKPFQERLQREINAALAIK